MNFARFDSEPVALAFSLIKRTRQLIKPPSSSTLKTNNIAM